MSARVAASTESDILESGAMRASVTAPTMAATIAIDRSARLRTGTVSLNGRQSVGTVGEMPL